MSRVIVNFEGNKTHFDGVIHGVKDNISELKGMVAGALTLDAGIELVKQTAEYADMIDKASLRMKLTTEETQALSIIAKDAGSSLETIEQAFRKIELARAKALGGDKKSLASFAALGISQDQLKKDSKTELAGKISGAASSGGEIQGVALAGLGLKGAAGDLTAIGDSLQNLNEKTDELKAKGAIMSDEDIANIAEAKDELELAGTILMAQIAPYISDAIEGFRIMWTSLQSYFTNLFTAIILMATQTIDTIKGLVSHLFSKETLMGFLKGGVAGAVTAKGSDGKSILDIGAGGAKDIAGDVKFVWTETAKDVGEQIDEMSNEKAKRKADRDKKRSAKENEYEGIDVSPTKEKPKKMFSDSLTSVGNMLGNSFNTGMDNVTTQLDLQKRTLESSKKIEENSQKQTELLQAVVENTKSSGDDW